MVTKATVDKFLQQRDEISRIHWSVNEAMESTDNALSPDRDKWDLKSLAGLDPDSPTHRNIRAHAKRLPAVEAEVGIRFEDMEVGSEVHRDGAAIGDADNSDG